jgi:hypothetical protein
VLLALPMLLGKKIHLFIIYSFILFYVIQNDRRQSTGSIYRISKSSWPLSEYDVSSLRCSITTEGSSSLFHPPSTLSLSSFPTVLDYD